MFVDIEISFTAIKVLFLEDGDINNELVSNKSSSGEKSFKYFIGYLYDDYEIKPLHIMLPKRVRICKNLCCSNQMDVFFDSKPIIKIF